jgi:hypothetical protein
MKSLSILIAVLFLQASLSEARAGIACDAVFSACVKTIDVPAVCWAARQAFINACGKTGPLCQNYNNYAAVAQWVCRAGSNFCSQHDQDALSDVNDWCKSADAKRFGVITYPGSWC